MSEIQLGFGPSPRPQYVYVSQDKSPTGWYLWNFAGDGHAEPIEHQALTGYITGIEVDTKEFKGKENKKLNVTVSAGPRNYIIQVGFYTAFARCMLASLARLRPEHLQTPFAIETQFGKEKTVFCTLYNAQNGGKITYTYPNSEPEVDNLFSQVATLFGPKLAKTGS
jgi:hypothetical protein